MSNALMDIRSLQVCFPGPTGIFFNRSDPVKAVDDVSFQIRPGETFGIVGESGSGKTVLLRSLVRLIKPTGGEIYYKGRNIVALSKRELHELRRDVQLIFQNPQTAVHPRMTVGQILCEPFRIHGIGSRQDREEKIRRTMEVVGLNPAYVSRYPHQFSGGQRQRIGIARALVLDPKLLLCDEPVSALDVSIQAQVLNLFQDLKERLSLTYLVIAHDLTVVRFLCDRVAVMYLGKFVEIVRNEDLYRAPEHPYTRALLSAVPTIKRSLANEGNSRKLLEGDLPSAAHPPKGCAFHPRCPEAQDICRGDAPQLKEIGPDHYVACYMR
ncbi:MAG: ATP-binding cassette domain-containing protein [Chloroflexi bacterium]|nr:ATP-binding cassette domain-containing protein [Chloroflexota bacterium]